MQLLCDLIQEIVKKHDMGDLGSNEKPTFEYTRRKVVDNYIDQTKAKGLLNKAH